MWIKVYINIKIFRADVFNARKLSSKSYLPLMGLEPTTSELEVQRAIRCATAAMRYLGSEILRAAGGKNSIFMLGKGCHKTGLPYFQIVSNC